MLADGSARFAPGTSTVVITIAGAGGTGTTDNHGVRIAGSGVRLLATRGSLELRGSAGAATESSSNGIAIGTGALVFADGDTTLTGECGLEPAEQLAIDINGRVLLRPSKGTLVINGTEQQNHSLRRLQLACGH